MPKRKVQNEQEVIQWIKEGRTNAWMMQKYLDKYDIETKSAMWSRIRAKYSLPALDARNDDLIPWGVEDCHKNSYHLQMLRHEGRARAGLPLSERSARRLKSFLENLAVADAVVLYEPKSKEGFYYVPRLDTDTDIIRLPPRTTKRNSARPDR